MAFSLDDRLRNDTLELAESEHSLLRVFNDNRYRWLILVPKYEHAIEWFDLPELIQGSVHREAMQCAQVLKTREVTKINIGALGNVVSQLHIHIVARHLGDPAWPGPVWGHSPRLPFDTPAFEEFKRSLTIAPLTSVFSFS